MTAQHRQGGVEVAALELLYEAHMFLVGPLDPGAPWVRMHYLRSGLNTVLWTQTRDYKY